MKVRLRVDSWWSAPTTPHMAAKTWSWPLVVAWRICSTQRFGPNHGRVLTVQSCWSWFTTADAMELRVTWPPDSCSELDLCAFSHVILQSRSSCSHDQEEIQCSSHTTGESRAHLSRHRCTSKSRPVTDLFETKSEFKKNHSTEERLSVIFFAESYICATRVVGKCPPCGACASGLCPRRARAPVERISELRK